MASRRSHTALDSKLIEYELWVPRGVGCSKFRYKSDIKSARIQLVKLLTFNTLYCEIVL